MTCIAVIADTPDTIALLEEVADAHRWDVVTCVATDHTDAAVQLSEPDVVMVDLDTLKLEVELVDAFRHNPATSAIPIVVCSSDRYQLKDQQNHLDAMVDAVLVKPFDLTDLDRCLDFALSCGMEKATTT